MTPTGANWRTHPTELLATISAPDPDLGHVAGHRAIFDVSQASDPDIGQEVLVGAWAVGIDLFAHGAVTLTLR